MTDKTIETTWDDFFFIVSILNEVCHGIDINDFEKEVGYTYDEIYALLKKINSFKEQDEKQPIFIPLSSREIDIIKAAYKEVLKQIEEWEFQTRVGVTIPEVDQVVKKLST